MSRKLIIFGNGLGMALNPKHFCLTDAMNRVWGYQDRLTNDDREIIGSLKNIEATRGPQSEDELASTQQALSYLSSFRAELGEEALNSWFKEAALTYPDRLNKYVFEVAFELYNYRIPEEAKEKWDTFLTAVIKYVADTRSHVATLNYDDLLYSAFIDGHEIDGEIFRLASKAPNNSGAPYIRDGFLSGEYKPDTFGYSGKCGHYLHLHGSPLYFSRKDDVQKLKRSDIETSGRELPRHIVLANRNDKQTIIRRSAVLKDYWDERLPKCIDEADEIILFGYSGLDAHLNNLIKEKHTGGIFVVEWSGAQHFATSSEVLEGKSVSPEEFWATELGEVEIIRSGDILDFKEWDDPSSHRPF